MKSVSIANSVFFIAYNDMLCNCNKVQTEKLCNMHTKIRDFFMRNRKMQKISRLFLQCRVMRSK